MGILSMIFGYRWSLYIVKNDNELLYAMNENAVMQMVGYVMNYFKDGGKPVEPWSLYLNFNKTHQKLKLLPDHFAPDGNGVSNKLIEQIETIDPNWQTKGAQPVFEEVATRKPLKISNWEQGKTNIREVMANVGKQHEVTFFSVMRQVFGVERN